MSKSGKIAKHISDYGSEGSIGSRFRVKRAVPLLEMIKAVYKKNGCVKIIDIGGTEQYWKIIPAQFLHFYKIEITIVNLPQGETPANSQHFIFASCDGCDLSVFKSNSFDIAHSNSVLEHVGDWDRMVKFAKELKRVGINYFVQTPNYWFPIEPHCMTPFFQWLPSPCRLWLVLHFQLGHWKKAESVSEGVSIVESARLLNRPKFRALFEESTIITERILGLPKSFVAISIVND